MSVYPSSTSLFVVGSFPRLARRTETAHVHARTDHAPTMKPHTPDKAGVIVDHHTYQQPTPTPPHFLWDYICAARCARQFWSTSEEPLLTVIVRQVGSAEDARAVVDWAAPVDAAQPATLYGGWDGGRHGGGDVPVRFGAAYGVSKEPVAVAVFTNQNESVKAEAVAKEVIATLAL